MCAPREHVKQTTPSDNGAFKERALVRKKRRVTRAHQRSWSSADSCMTNLLGAWCGVLSDLTQVIC